MKNALEEFQNHISEIRDKYSCNKKTTFFYNNLMDFSYLFINIDNKDIIKNLEFFTNVIVVSQYQDSHESYLCFCLDKYFIIINEKDFDLVSHIFFLNLYSIILVFNENTSIAISSKIQNINIRFKISVIDDNCRTMINNLFSEFSKNLSTQKIFTHIKYCVSALLFEKSYLNNERDRIVDYKRLFNTNQQKIEINQSNYIQISHIHAGHSSKIQLIYHIEIQKLFILKSHTNPSLFKRENEYYINLHHPFLSESYGSTDINGQKTLILEYIEGYVLSDLIKKVKLNLNDKIKIIFQIMIIIEYLHEKKIIYRDLKPNNIIIDKFGTVVLIDFDEAVNELEKKEQYSNDLFSPYLAPEIALNNKYSYSADIYSMGCIIYFMIFEKSPDFNHEKNNIDAFPPEFTAFEGIFKRCVSFENRPKISELINDFFLKFFMHINILKLEEDTIKIVKNSHNDNYFSYWVFISEYQNPYSIYKLAKMHEKGILIDKSYSKAFKYYEYASQRDHLKSSYMLGIYFLEGKFVQQNTSIAIKYLELAAMNNHAKALFKLGEIYFYICRDKGIECITYAAEQLKLQEAMIFLGRIYYNGENVNPDVQKSIYFYSLAAELNNSEAQFYLGTIFLSGKYFSPNIEKAKYYFKLAADQNHSLAQHNLGYLYFSIDIKKAVYYFSLSANQNQVESMDILGNIYSNKDFSVFDINKSIKYYSDAAERNFLKSQMKLACIYMSGEYVPMDIDKAIKYLTMAAEQNDITANYTLGMIYYNFKNDFEKAIKHFLFASKFNPDANYYLGLIFIFSMYKNKDIQRAIHYFKLAAKQNHLKALFALGNIYINGKFIHPDAEKAIYYYKLAANQNHLEAMYNLGCIYNSNRYGLKDVDKSIHYYTLAADQNHSMSQLNLGTLYFESNDHKDIEKAIYYLSAAANNQIVDVFFNLGNVYLNIDINKKIEYWEKAANRGHREAKFKLGLHYYNQDISKAIHYLKLASDNNHSIAQFILGTEYIFGHYVKNYDEGIKYLSFYMVV